MFDVQGFMQSSRDENHLDFTGLLGGSPSEACQGGLISGEISVGVVVV